MKTEKFVNQVKNDYARPNLFEVRIDNFATAKFVVKAASIPAASIGTIEVPYQNRKIKIPGDRTFQDWTVTIINDENYELREQLMSWQAGLAFFDDYGSTLNPMSSHKVMEVYQKNRTGGLSALSQISGWPSEIGAIDLSWETTDSVQEYQVTFSVTWASGR